MNNQASRLDNLMNIKNPKSFLIIKGIPNSSLSQAVREAWGNPTLVLI